ncbi:MAG: V-type ATP synthase subunit H, partial [Halobacteriales archaeon]|nr:V-type ATP synthase subunit H [Halobacteriales archaeon]
VAEAEADAESLREERLAAAREEIEAERQEILAEGEAERAALESAAADNRESVVEYVVDRFDEAVHAQA